MQFSEQSSSLANPSHYIRCNAMQKGSKFTDCSEIIAYPSTTVCLRIKFFLHSCVVVLYFLTTTGALIMSPERKWFCVVLLNEKCSGNQHLLTLYRIINKTILSIHCHLYETGFSLLFTVKYHTKPLRLKENLTITFIK